jgi:hypothetical protein
MFLLLNNTGDVHMKKNVAMVFVLSSFLLSGCVAGSATAGYSLKAQSASNLTTEAEQRIVDRVKSEVKAEMGAASSSQVAGA